MVQWNKATWYSQATAVLLVILIFCAGFYVGSVKSGNNDGDKTTGAYSEAARLGTDSSKVKILTGTILNTRNIVFQNELNDKIIDVLSIANDTVGPPDYRIVRGNNQDWVVVTKIEESGTGYIKYTDDWYTLNGGLKKILSYPAKETLSPYPFSESKSNVYLETKVAGIYPDDTLITIESSQKTCSQTMDGKDGVCTESSKKYEYRWNDESDTFIVDQGNNI